MRKMEEEAYLEGQMTLRDFEDNLKKENKVMAETKIQEERSIFAPNHYCVHHGGVQMEGEVKLGKVLRHNWNEDLQKVTKYDMQFEDGTILENVKAEDIFVTEASLAEGHGSHAAKKDVEEDAEEAVDEGKDKPCPKCKKLVCEPHCFKKKKTEDLKEKQFANDDSLDGDGDGKPKWADPDDPANKRKETTNENWFKGSKNQLLFERLVEKWIK
jgi:hypothetical protein